MDRDRAPGAGQAGSAVPAGRPMPNERLALIISMTTPFLQTIRKNGGAEPWPMPGRLRRQPGDPSEFRPCDGARVMFTVYSHYTPSGASCQGFFAMARGCRKA